MAAYGYGFNQTSNCCSSRAAACSSARICLVLDAAMILVVSIFVRLISIRLWGFGT